MQHCKKEIIIKIKPSQITLKQEISSERINYLSFYPDLGDIGVTL